MKKYFIMLVMMFTMSVYSFAEESTATKMAETERYELKINHRRLACVLDMSSDQMEMSNDIISELESDMMFAAVMNTEESRNAIVTNAVKKNIKYMHYILNDNQYKKYLTLLSLTLEHRGFAMTTALFAFCKDEDGDWCVLASERGLEATDFRGAWNCPCGYLDYDEATKECAVRECFEETRVKLPIESLIFIGYEDDPVKANRQNVTFRFGAKIEDHITSDFEFSKEHNEDAEVGEIKWVKIKDIDNYEWAFNYKTRIEEISLQLRLWDEDEDV